MHNQRSLLSLDNGNKKWFTHREDTLHGVALSFRTGLAYVIIQTEIHQFCRHRFEPYNMGIDDIRIIQI